MAGRSMPGSDPRTWRAIAMSAPVLPADTAALASPSATAASARPMLDSRPERKAWEGLALMGTERLV